jgi:hypothetical protein
MTVAYLIEILQTLNPDLKVFVDGYEGGYDELKTVKKKLLQEDKDDHPNWYGHWDDPEVDNTGEIVLGVYLPRSS